MKRLTAKCLLALAVLPAMVYANVAYTSKDAHLRAGPARDYPVVAILTAGFQVDVQGCLQDYTWCDVVAGPYRGWVYAANISYPYQGNSVPVLNNGALLGIAAFSFILGDYWSNHYRDRPWYPDRGRWSHPPVNRPPMPRPGFNGPGTDHRERSPGPAPNVRPSGPPHGNNPGEHGRQAPQRPSQGGQTQRPPHKDAPQGQQPQNRKRQD